MRFGHGPLLNLFCEPGELWLVMQSYKCWALFADHQTDGLGPPVENHCSRDTFEGMHCSKDGSIALGTLFRESIALGALSKGCTALGTLSEGNTALRTEKGCLKFLSKVVDFILNFRR